MYNIQHIYYMYIHIQYIYYNQILKILFRVAFTFFVSFVLFYFFIELKHSVKYTNLTVEPVEFLHTYTPTINCQQYKIQDTPKLPKRLSYALSRQYPPP